jgi:hypothetical protein
MCLEGERIRQRSVEAQAGFPIYELSRLWRSENLMSHPEFSRGRKYPSHPFSQRECRENPAPQVCRTVSKVRDDS